MKEQDYIKGIQASFEAGKLFKQKRE